MHAIEYELSQVTCRKWVQLERIIKKIKSD